MKKMFISVVALAMSVMAMATETAYVELRLTGNSGLYDEMTLTEDDSYTNAYEDGADAAKIMYQANTRSVLIYGMVDGLECGDVAAANLDGHVIGFMTNMIDDEYTMSFEVAEGRTLYLYDRVADQYKMIAQGESYAFSVEASQVGRVAINERFVINYERPNYVMMKGDFSSQEWAYTDNFDYNGKFVLSLNLDADKWYHFQLEELYNLPATIAADGSAFDREHNSHNLPVDGWHEQLTLHTDLAGTYTFTWDDLKDNLTITFPALPNAYDIILNDNYLATFSAAEPVIIPAGLNAYAAKYVSETEVLDLTLLSNYIPANTGVILYNPTGGSTAKKDFSLEKYDGSVDPLAPNANDLKPASAYADNHTGHIYVLHGDMMYTYEDEEKGIKPNKAFLQIDAQYPAPARIAFRFNGEQGVENVAAEGKAVKFVENGQVFIKRGNEVFNLQGQIVK